MIGMSLTTLSRPINDFMIVRLFGARSAFSFAESAVARMRSEEGGVGMQAAIISGGLVLVALAVTALLRTRTNEIVNTLTVSATNAVNSLTIT